MSSELHDFNVFMFIDKDQIEFVRILKPEVLKNARDKENENSPLLYALYKNKLEIAKWFFAGNYFDSLFDVNKHGQGFLQAYSKNKKSILFLQENLTPVIKQVMETREYNSIKAKAEFIEKCRQTFGRFFPKENSLKRRHSPRFFAREEKEVEKREVKRSRKEVKNVTDPQPPR